MERILLYIKSVFEREFAKSLAELNEIQLEEDEMPVMVFGELDDVDAEVASKVGQRLGATGLFPRQKSMLVQLWRNCGYDTTEIEALDEEELLAKMTDMTTRSGDGMAEGLPSGTGGNTGGNGDASISNNDNAA